MMALEDEGDINLAIVRTDQAATVVRDQMNAMRDPQGGYTVTPTADQLLADLHSLVNHLMVVRSALERLSLTR